MKLCNEITMLPKPNINAKDLNYILNSKEVYVNLFEIKMKKQLTLYQYPYTVNPLIGSSDMLIINKYLSDPIDNIKNFW